MISDYNIGFKARFIDSENTYTGAELRPHYLLTKHNLKGSTLAAFIGPCMVETKNLVDWEDRLSGEIIKSKSMLHFLGEFFSISLKEGVLLQRLIVCLISEELASRSINVIRSGDDLFINNKKLSVSIVTSSTVSQLMHIGVNCDPEGAPVDAIGLNELNVEPVGFAKSILGRIESEWMGIQWACVKVRPVS